MASALRMGGVSPLVGSRRLTSALKTVPSPMTAKVIVIDDAGVVRAGFIRSGHQRQEGGEEQHEARRRPT